MSFAAKVKNFFPFRSKINFSITVLGFGSTGYFIARSYTEKKFEHPLINESMRILKKNQQIIELVGYPFSIKSALRATAVINEQDAFFMFVVKGPKGYVTIDLAGKSLTQSEIKKEKVLASEYIVLDPETKELLQKEQQNKDKVAIPDEAKFWKIDYLYADLGGQYRIVVLPEKKNEQNKENSQALEQYPYYELTERINLKDLEIEEELKWKEIVSNEPQTEIEMEEMRKFRMQEFYRKIGYVRFYMFFIFIGGAASIYVYLQKNRRKSVVGSQIHVMAKHILQQNQFIQKYIGPSIKFSSIVRGQQVDQKAEFEQDFYTSKGSGTAKVKGTIDPKTSVWNIDSLEVELKDQKGLKIENKKLV